MGALHGVLYVLECDLLDDTAKQLIPTVSEYLLSNLRAIAQWVSFGVSFLQNKHIDLISTFNELMMAKTPKSATSNRQSVLMPYKALQLKQFSTVLHVITGL